jgi:hypothetical protein
MRGGNAGNILVSGTLLSIFLLLGSLTYVSSDLSRIAAPKTTSRTAIFPPGLYNLTFIQEVYSDPGSCCSWIPWSITLSNPVVGSMTMTKGDISLATVSLVSSNESLSSISFYVPYGSYSYRVNTVFGGMFGQVDFSPSNSFPVDVNLEFVGVTAGG